MNWFNGGWGSGLRDDPVNPGNGNLSIPTWDLLSDLRPTVSLGIGENWELVTKLRGRVDLSDVQVSGQSDSWKFSGFAELNEGYVAWRPSEHIQVSAGRMYLQWGPAELLNPSNGVFQITLDQRSNLWVAQGKDLVKLSYTEGKNWNAILFGEVLNYAAFASNNPNSTNQPFERRGQAKVEYMNDDSTRYVGGGGGYSELGRLWFGEYGSVGPAEGWSLYADMRQMKGSSAYFPVANQTGGLSLSQSRLNDPRFYNLADAGIRFEDRVDIRLEYVRNDEAYSSSERQMALLAVTDALSLQRYLSPGFQLPGRDFLYLSVRVPDLGPKKTITLFSQYLQSLTDGSGALFSNGVWNISDRALFFLELGIALGGPNSELGQAVGSQLTLGTRMTW